MLQRVKFLNWTKPQNYKPVHECVVCALYPLLNIGRICCVTPITVTCRHRSGWAPSFRRTEFGAQVASILIYTLAAVVACYIYLTVTNEGLVRFIYLSNALQCGGGLDALFFGNWHLEIRILELNGLSKIIENRHRYGVSKLLTITVTKKLQKYSNQLIAAYIIIFFIDVTYEVYRASSSIFNAISLLNVISSILSVTSILVICMQAWVKMVCQRLLTKMQNVTIRRILEKDGKTESGRHHPKLEEGLKGIIRLQIALVRNFKEYNKFWNPSMLIMISLACALMIINFYILCTALVSQTYNFFYTMLEIRTYCVVLGTLVFVVQQQRLNDVVS